MASLKKIKTTDGTEYDFEAASVSWLKSFDVSLTAVNVTAGWYRLCTINRGGTYMILGSGTGNNSYPSYALFLSITYTQGIIRLVSCCGTSSKTDKFRIVRRSTSGSSQYNWDVEFHHSGITNNTNGVIKFVMFGHSYYNYLNIISSLTTQASDPPSGATVKEVNVRVIKDSPLLKVKLDKTTDGVFDGSDLNTNEKAIGITGELQIANGGTGSGNAKTALGNLGGVPLASQGYCVCNTDWEQTTDYTASMTGFYLTDKCIVSVLFTHAVKNGTTLNINNTGAVPINYKGIAITNGVIYDNTIAVLMYQSADTVRSSAWNLISVDPNDGKYELQTNKVTSISSSSTDTQYPSAKCVYDIIGDIETLLAAI